MKARLDAELQPGRLQRRLQRGRRGRPDGDAPPRPRHPALSRRHGRPDAAASGTSSRARGTTSRRAAPPLATGGVADPFLAHVLPLFERADDVAIVAAFVQDSGLDAAPRRVSRRVARGLPVRLVTGDYLEITQATAPRAPRRLELSSRPARATWTTTGRGRVGPPARSRRGSSRRHVSTLRDRRSTRRRGSSRAGRSASAFVGSSNVSRSALDGGVEWNLRVDREREPAPTRASAAASRTSGRSARRSPRSGSPATRPGRAPRPPLPPGEDAAEPRALVPEPHACSSRRSRARAGAAGGPRPRARRPGDRPRQDLARGVRRRGSAPRSSGASRGSCSSPTAPSSSPRPRTRSAALARDAGHRPARLLVRRRRRATSTATWSSPRSRSSPAPTAWRAWRGSASTTWSSTRSTTPPRPATAASSTGSTRASSSASPRRPTAPTRPTSSASSTTTSPTGPTSARGSRQGLLAPFSYFGLQGHRRLREHPLAEPRFDPEALATAAPPRRGWSASGRPGASTRGRGRSSSAARSRTPASCASWLASEGVRCAGGHRPRVGRCERGASRWRIFEQGRARRALRRRPLQRGRRRPRVDRVVMLRPTESPVVFLQQLGRGLRRAEGKDSPHRHRLRRQPPRLPRPGPPPPLARGAKPVALRSFLDGAADAELPPGCSVDSSSRPSRCSASLLPRGENEVERVYRELKAARGERPTAGELYRMGYLTAARRSGLVRASSSRRATSTEEAAAFTPPREWFRELETTRDDEVLQDGRPRGAARGRTRSGRASRRRARRALPHDPAALARSWSRDLEGVAELGGARRPDGAAGSRYWRREPDAAPGPRARSGAGSGWTDDRLSRAFPVPEGARRRLRGDDARARRLPPRAVPAAVGARGRRPPPSRARSSGTSATRS